VTTPLQWLEEDLKRAQQKYGPEAPYTKDLQKQLDDTKAGLGKTLQETYFTGRPLAEPKRRR
jgi:hypothetical protein